jgi:hypothetical protein
MSIDHLRDYINLALAIHGVAVIICNLTPTPRDDAALGTISALASKAYRVLEIAAGIVTPMAKR